MWHNHEGDVSHHLCCVIEPNHRRDIASFLPHFENEKQVTGPAQSQEKRIYVKVWTPADRLTRATFGSIHHNGINNG